MKKVKAAMIVFVALLGMTFFTTPLVAGATPASEINSGVKSVGGDSGGGLGPQLKIVVNILLYILGAIAVIMIVIGGIRYTTSNGDSGSIKSAKDTILYSVVGLVIAMLAYAIVNFVVQSF